MNNIENLKNYLEESRMLLITACEEFKAKKTPDSSLLYEKALHFSYVASGNRIMTFNFDYYFLFNYESPFDYINVIYSNHRSGIVEVPSRSTRILEAVLALTETYNNILVNELSHDWFISDYKGSNYYKDQIKILEKYREDVLFRDYAAINMEFKLGKGINKRLLDRVNMDLTIVANEINLCTNILYTVFDIIYK